MEGRMASRKEKAASTLPRLGAGIRWGHLPSGTRSQWEGSLH